MRLSIHTDGGSKGNPGPAAIGLVIADADTKVELDRYREDIGIKTNNEAEYTALIRALERVKDLQTGQSQNSSQSQTHPHLKDLTEIHVYSDSQLMVSQLNGIYKVKQPHIRELVFKVRVLESELRVKVLYHHVLREKNKLADALVNDEA